MGPPYASPATRSEGWGWPLVTNQEAYAKLEAEPGRDLPGAWVWLRLDQNLVHTLPSTLASFRLGLTVWKLFYYVYLLYFSPSRFPESKDIDLCTVGSSVPRIGWAIDNFHGYSFTITFKRLSV